MADGNEIEFDFLSNINLILGITDNNSDQILQLYISMFTDKILNYCNISKLPSALNYTLCQMVADFYRDETRKNKTSEVVGTVSSISEDGRSVSFTNGSELSIAADDKISNTRELNKYKKLYRG